MRGQIQLELIIGKNTFTERFLGKPSTNSLFLEKPFPEAFPLNFTQKEPDEITRSEAQLEGNNNMKLENHQHTVTAVVKSFCRQFKNFES